MILTKSLRMPTTSSKFSNLSSSTNRRAKSSRIRADKHLKVRPLKLYNSARSRRLQTYRVSSLVKLLRVLKELMRRPHHLLPRKPRMTSGKTILTHRCNNKSQRSQVKITRAMKAMMKVLAISGIIIKYESCRKNLRSMNPQRISGTLVRKKKTSMRITIACKTFNDRRSK